MIKLAHSQRNEIYLKLIRADINEFIKIIALLLSGATQEILLMVNVDPKVLKKKILPDYLSLKLTVSNYESLEYNEGILSLNLDIESYEQIYDQLEGILEGEEVMPEITDIFVHSWKKEKGLGLIVE